MIPPADPRAWVDVDLAALVRNARAVARAARAPLLPMIKADGYGLGAVPIARSLATLDPWGFGVATTPEALELRRSGIDRPLIVFTPLLSHDAGAFPGHGVRPCIGDPEALEAWLALGSRPFHLEIDTGLSRAGIPFTDDSALARVGRLLEKAEGWEGVFTHFHSADERPATAAEQWRRLQHVVERLGRRPRWVHAASSAGCFAGDYGADFARPGIYLYGGAAGEQVGEPVARFRARVVAVRRIAPGDTVSYGATWSATRSTTIATVAAGYADGVPRSLSSAGTLEIRDRVHPIAGRVTMDMTMCDVGDTPVVPGDVATVFGGLIPVETQARAAGTISYELLTRLGGRVARRYHPDPGPEPPA